jgi:hypothetical protein
MSYPNRIADLRRPTEISLMWKFILLLEVAIWFPLVFIGFDPHHDGLILTTVHLTREAIQFDSPWPFNQYGPSWALIYSAFTWGLPDNLVFLGLRFMTVFFYLLTAWIVWKISLQFLSRRNSFLSVLVYFFTQPFVSGLGSDLVPWPSAFLMPIVAFIVLASILLVDARRRNTQLFYLSYAIGAALPIVLFTRAQIGLLALSIEIILFIVLKKWRLFVIFFSGVFTTTAILIIFLAKHNFLWDSLYDEFVFGSSYLTGDRSSYPTPIFTTLGVVIFLLMLNFSKNIINFAIWAMRISFLRVSALLIMIVSVTLSIFLLLGVHSNLITISLRRFWISMYLAIIVFSLLVQARKSFFSWRENMEYTPELVRRNYLLGMAIASQAQVFPLFDQMHFWWGSVPAVILVVLSLKEELTRLHISSQIRRLSIHVLLFFFLLVGLVQWSQQIAQIRQPYPSNISQFLYVDPKISSAEKSLQAFFLEDIKPGSSVLNLCENPNVFFVNNQFESSSRVFLLWTNILDDKKLVNQMVNSDPSYVVTCSMNRVPATQAKAEIQQARILARALPDRELLSSYRQSDNMTWRIWSKD